MWPFFWMLSCYTKEEKKHIFVIPSVAFKVISIRYDVLVFFPTIRSTCKTLYQFKYVWYRWVSFMKLFLLPLHYQSASILYFSSFSETEKGRMGLGFANTDDAVRQITPERSNIDALIKPCVCGWVVVTYISVT